MNVKNRPIAHEIVVQITHAAESISVTQTHTQHQYNNYYWFFFSCSFTSIYISTMKYMICVRVEYVIVDISIYLI